VLLENKNGTLPLKATTTTAAGAKLKIAVVGPFADCQSCYYGAGRKRQKTAGFLFFSAS